MMATWTGVAVAAMALVTASPQQVAVEKGVEAWRKDRLQRLQSPTGWLTLSGLHWLREGSQRAGSGPGMDITMATGLPAEVGTFTLAKDGAVTFAPARDVRAELDGGGVITAVTALPADVTGKPATVKIGTFSFFIIKRGEKTGIRVRDTQARARREFAGIPHYPVEARWVVEGRWEPAAAARTLPVPNVLGMSEAMEAPGDVVFTVDGVEHRLTPVLEEPGATELFFIFADETNRQDTYGAGRFFYAPLPKNGRVTLDFNRAYNPPCAFTPYATCPIPPAQNRLKLKVTAGEKRYAGAGH